jgi:hypothetical protein
MPVWGINGTFETLFSVPRQLPVSFALLSIPLPRQDRSNDCFGKEGRTSLGGSFHPPLLPPFLILAHELLQKGLSDTFYLHCSYLGVCRVAYRAAIN